jgi:hypothetical protein
MQIGAYTIMLTTVEFHNVKLVETILKHYFCPLFSAHGTIYSLAVCEDKMYTENGITTFTYYENFLQTPYANLSAVTIQEYGSADDSGKMIAEIFNIMRRNGDEIVF